ncbi:hypothetical protein ASD50_02520 [Mesorhizobium sp. Root552]|nr:hypothetical protein ASD50_02520 [Mesorhizobium sp. Root552]
MHLQVLGLAKSCCPRRMARGFQQAASWKSWRSIVSFGRGVKRKLAPAQSGSFTQRPESGLYARAKGHRMPDPSGMISIKVNSQECFAP